MKTDDQAAEEIARLGETLDPERAHRQADDLLVELLTGLGYVKAAKAFAKAREGFWYS